MKTLLINLSNIKTGGALQVASSFLEELKVSKQSLKVFNTTILISSSVSNLSITKKLIKSSEVKIIENENNFFKQFSLKYIKLISSFDIVFNLFGPHLYCIKHKRQCVISGFAQAWILFPKNSTYQEFGFIKKGFYTLKYKTLSLYFSLSDSFFVEHEYLKSKLENLYPGKTVYVARNSINQVFEKSNTILNNRIINSSYIFRIGVICDNYPHKNLKIIPSIIAELNRMKVKFNFVLTLNKDEYDNTGFNLITQVKNYGKISIEECISFYNSVDIVFQPSNLECFSASIIEALFMRKPLVCANYIFNKEIVKEHALYFTPNCPKSASEKIAFVINNYNKLASKKFTDKGKFFVSKNYNHSNRFKSYLNILNLKKKHD